MDTENSKPRILKATRLLQAKVGMGPDVDEKLVRRSQKLIDSNQVDFVPMAKEYLGDLEALLHDAAKGPKDRSAIEEIINPVMQLKANAAMFNYPLIGRLATIMLNFLETIEKIDEDVIAIGLLHQQAMETVIASEMKGDGGTYGEELARELKDACKRYFAQQAALGIVLEDKDAFFIDG